MVESSLGAQPIPCQLLQALNLLLVFGLQVSQLLLQDSATSAVSTAATTAALTTLDDPAAAAWSPAT